VSRVFRTFVFLSYSGRLLVCGCFAPVPMGTGAKSQAMATTSASRHHLHCNQRGMALPGRGHRSVQPPRSRLVDATGDAQQPGHRRTGDGMVRRSPDKSAGRIFHSDRGSQYASHEFSRALQKCGIIASMSRKGNCWDSAPSETLFASLKVERLHGQRFETIRQAKDETLAWLLWYNQTRMHSTINYVSPIVSVWSEPS